MIGAPQGRMAVEMHMNRGVVYTATYKCMFMQPHINAHEHRACGC